MHRIWSATLLLSVILSLASVCVAQQSGGIPIRVDLAPTPRCINYNTDQVWLTLYRVVTRRNRGLFRSDNQTAIIMNVQVRVQPQSDRTLVFPLSSRVNIRRYGAGQVSIPVEYTLVNGLALKQRTGGKVVYYTGLSVDATIVNLSGQHGLGIVLNVLDQAVGSRKLPIPDNPYFQAAGYLLDFANRAITQSITEQNDDNKYTTASLTFNFDPDGTCAANSPDGQAFETTGVKAILMSDGIKGPGYVPIEHTDDYCWTAAMRPAFVLKAAHIVGDRPCGDPSYSGRFVQVTNDFVAYFLQEREVKSDPRLSKATDDKRESLQLCTALGLSAAECPAAY